MIIDSTLLTIIPPIVAAVLTYIVSNKKSRIEQAKVLADVQSHAIEQVRQAEEKMRAEIWAELEKVRRENNESKEQIRHQGLRILDLERQLEASAKLRMTLGEQVSELERLVDTYKNRIVELENKK
jgi:CII-binding regulator of phage lambda lysogenization HflD